MVTLMSSPRAAGRRWPTPGRQRVRHGHDLAVATGTSVRTNRPGRRSWSAQAAADARPATGAPVGSRTTPRTSEAATNSTLSWAAPLRERPCWPRLLNNCCRSPRSAGCRTISRRPLAVRVARALGDRALLADIGHVTPGWLLFWYQPPPRPRNRLVPSERSARTVSDPSALDVRRLRERQQEMSRVTTAPARNQLGHEDLRPRGESTASIRMCRPDLADRERRLRRSCPVRAPVGQALTLM